MVDEACNLFIRQIYTQNGFGCFNGIFLKLVSQIRI